MVYAAGNRALAALEMLVHLTTSGSRSKPYSIIEVSIPLDQIANAAHGSKPCKVGNEWLRSGKSLALRVPSVLIPEEPNFLINPDHPAFRNLRIGKPTSFRFDPRI